MNDNLEYLEYLLYDELEITSALSAMFSIDVDRYIYTKIYNDSRFATYQKAVKGSTEILSEFKLFEYINSLEYINKNDSTTGYARCVTVSFDDYKCRVYCKNVEKYTNELCSEKYKLLYSIIYEMVYLK